MTAKKVRKVETIFIFLLLVSVVDVFASVELDISGVAQDESEWCWAACSEMVLRAYGYSNDQTEIANWAVSGADCTNDLYGTTYSVDQILRHFGNISTNHTPFNPSTGGGNLKKEHVINEIEGGRPFLAGLYRATTRHHVVLVTGFTGSGIGSDMDNIIYKDPDGGVRGERSYAEFVQFAYDQEWGETLRLVTPPREEIPLGFGPNHMVRLYEEDCTQDITASTQSLSFRAVKSGDSPTSWEWKLSFAHSEGTEVLATWTSNISQMDLTWNIENFSLPNHYNWKYNRDGKIPGRIEVICSDPAFHYDAVNVFYIPDDLYPGAVIFENQTITDAQPEVRAHEWILIQSSTFSTGGSTAFRSGRQLDIWDGTYIGNGSDMDFIVDPALQ